MQVKCFCNENVVKIFRSFSPEYFFNVNWIFITNPLSFVVLNSIFPQFFINFFLFWGNLRNVDDENFTLNFFYGSLLIFEEKSYWEFSSITYCRVHRALFRLKSLIFFLTQKHFHAVSYLL